VQENDEELLAAMGKCTEEIAAVVAAARQEVGLDQA